MMEIALYALLGIGLGLVVIAVAEVMLHCTVSLPEGRENAAPLPSGRDQQGRPASCRSRAIWAVIQSSRACHTDDPCHNSIRYFVTHPRALRPDNMPGFAGEPGLSLVLWALD